ncbi:MAG: FmdB family transcriptional regulator [Dermatophilaceae bacterium]|nr:FmdB family transcriptional regulator [Dermatophilaceae bacterium]
MPTYSYACQECGHAFDIRQSFTDDALTVCPSCGEPRLRKVIHPVGIAFKGSGFYKTDSRASSKGAGASTPADGADKKDTASATSSSSDSSGGTSASAGSSSSGSNGSGSSSGSGGKSTSSSTAS